MSTKQIDIAVLALIGIVVVLGIVGLHEAALGFAMLLEVVGVGLFVFTFAQRLIASQGASQDGPSGRIDIALIAVMVAIVALGIASKDTVDAKGKLLEPGFGLLASLGLAAAVGIAAGLFFLVVFGVRISRAMQPHAEQDFSSLSPADEKAFLPHEHYMQTNTKRAATLGMGITAGVFVVFAAITMGLYTPCSAYCSRPPGTCSTDKEKADFMAACETACGNLRQSKGDEFIDKLTGCAFSASAEGQCEEPTKAAIALGLWCVQK